MVNRGRWGRSVASGKRAVGWVGVGVDQELGSPGDVYLELGTRTGQCKLDPYGSELSDSPIDATVASRKEEKRCDERAERRWCWWCSVVVNAGCESSRESGNRAVLTGPYASSAALEAWSLKVGSPRTWARRWKRSMCWDDHTIAMGVVAGNLWVRTKGAKCKKNVVTSIQNAGVLCCRAHRSLAISSIFT